MNAITIKHFDKLNFVDEAKKTGANEEFARLIAQELEDMKESNIEKVTNQALEKELSQFANKADLLATQADLKSEIKDVEIRLNASINSAVNKIIAVITFAIAIATFLIKFH